MKITVLDGYTCNPGDLSWAPFEKFGDFEAFEYTKRADVLERCNKSDIIISNKTAFPREVLKSLIGLNISDLFPRGTTSSTLRPQKSSA